MVCKKIIRPIKSVDYNLKDNFLLMKISPPSYMKKISENTILKTF